MSENPKEPSRLTAEFTANEIAVALVEYLVRHRDWPTGMRYDNTILTVGTLSVFTAEFGPMFPGGGTYSKVP